MKISDVIFTNFSIDCLSEQSNSVDFSERSVQKSNMNLHPNGTIVMLGLGEDSAVALKEWCDWHKIPCLDEHELHCTVLFSRQPVEHLVTLDSKSIEIFAKIIGWKKLGSALALELESANAVKMHNWMINQGGTHDFPTFITHTSVSYDWGDRTDLPKVVPTFVLKFDRIIVEPIKSDPLNTDND